MGGRGILLVRRAVADMALDDDQGRPVVGALGVGDRVGDPLAVVGVADPLDLPAIAEKAGGDILAEGERGVALDRDVVAVVDPAEVAEPQMAGERGRLAADALHHAAVAAQRVDVVVEDVEAGPVEVPGQPIGGDRHADAVGDALAERAGRGLDPRGQMVFGMARAFAAELAEMLQVVERHRGRAEALVFRVDRGDAGQMQAANRAASRRGPRTARNGRGWARSGRRDRSAENAATRCRRPAPSPSACRDGRNWPAAPHRCTRCGWC